MGKSLRVLFVEDLEDDMLLTLRELKKGWDDVTFERVETKQAMAAALDKQKWDIVISDYSMPHFSGIDALEVFNESGLDIPFILVSGKIGEDKAVQMMKTGAHDFVMKGNLARLIPAIERELGDAQSRWEKKKADQTIRDSLREKEVLLREIHHRVRNNLQIISSLLDMVSTRTSDKEAIDLFNNVNTKIYAMSAIHSQLYERKQFDGIDMEEYLKKLVDRIFSAYPEKRGQIALILDVPKVVLSLDQAVPCGLVLNELISNSLKHAFNKEGQGIIEVSIKREGNSVFLRIKDNGTGIQGIDIHKTESLGIKMVRTLALDQLEGNLKVNHVDGTEFLINFTATEETLVHEKTA